MKANQGGKTPYFQSILGVLPGTRFKFITSNTAVRELHVYLLVTGNNSVEERFEFNIGPESESRTGTGSGSRVGVTEFWHDTRGAGRRGARRGAGQCAGTSSTSKIRNVIGWL
ncbi:hypothetical protein EVAR_58740_1 [Eumeta japonica]|uniref:Uncharacterized protein n=1 Tax=Eumeta variegata TaxID=151549 RepID=A0A4C1YRH5_EUMVA|nr:hypothetical protein EVAR_58740_1 [Eumeta japonica]